MVDLLHEVWGETWPDGARATSVCLAGPDGELARSLLDPEGNPQLIRTFMAGSRMVGGVYHPRARGGAMSDALADARRALGRLTRVMALRGAGLLLFAAALAALVALISFHADDASFNNANARPVSNLLGPLGARLRHGSGRTALGWLGIAMILAAIGWAIADWDGSAKLDWTP